MTSKLLIVDDSMITRETIVSYVDGMELEVVGSASDGVTALEKFREMSPDLVSLDITMPEMDGLTCLREMLAIDPTVRILVVSAISDAETAVEAMTLGASGFLPKPFDRDSYRLALQDVIEQSLS